MAEGNFILPFENPESTDDGPIKTLKIIDFEYTHYSFRYHMSFYAFVFFQLLKIAPGIGKFEKEIFTKYCSNRVRLCV